jgi:nickel-dependent lactate racemase
MIGVGHEDRLLTEDETRDVLSAGLASAGLSGRRVLVIIPDGTRSGPMPVLFRLLCDLLRAEATALDYLIALGTHRAMSEDAIDLHVGVVAAERGERCATARVFQHRWDLPRTFRTVGIISRDEAGALTGGLLAEALPVRLNKMIFDYDHILICGPVFPHEVAGFSGGHKYLVPGIASAEIINFTHWVGALETSMNTIGLRDTPTRAIIERAALFVDLPITGCSYVVKDSGLAGLFVGAVREAWQAATDLSARIHITYVERESERALSIAPTMYDDLWTGAKAMYKVEPAIADGGEVIIYAPHITEVSYTHGRLIDQIGYHVRDYFLKQWDRFRDFPGAVLAHSTHLKGLGTFDAESGIEIPRIQVTLATGIPEERCRRINLGYRDPRTINVEEWANREDEGMLLVRKGGEILYRSRHR